MDFIESFYQSGNLLSLPTFGQSHSPKQKKLPPEIIQKTLALIDTVSVMAAISVFSEWYEATQDNNFWKWHFVNNYSEPHKYLEKEIQRIPARLLPWKMASLRESIFRSPEYVSLKHCKCLGLLSSTEWLILEDDLLKVFDSNTSTKRDIFPYPISTYEIYDDKVIAYFSDRKNGFGIFFSSTRKSKCFSFPQPCPLLIPQDMLEIQYSFYSQDYLMMIFTNGEIYSLNPALEDVKFIPSRMPSSRMDRPHLDGEEPLKELVESPVPLCIEEGNSILFKGLQNNRVICLTLDQTPFIYHLENGEIEFPFENLQLIFQCEIEDSHFLVLKNGLILKILGGEIEAIKQPDSDDDYEVEWADIEEKGIALRFHILNFPSEKPTRRLEYWHFLNSKPIEKKVEFQSHANFSQFQVLHIQETELMIIEEDFEDYIITVLNNITSGFEFSLSGEVSRVIAFGDVFFLYLSQKQIRFYNFITQENKEIERFSHEFLSVMKVEMKKNTLFFSILAQNEDNYEDDERLEKNYEFNMTNGEWRVVTPPPIPARTLFAGSFDDW